MWGSDISRVMGRAGTIRLAPEGREYAKHTYAEALFYLKHTDRLTADQREWLLGRTAATVLGWGYERLPGFLRVPGRADDDPARGGNTSVSPMRPAVKIA